MLKRAFRFWKNMYPVLLAVSDLRLLGCALHTSTWRDGTDMLRTYMLRGHMLDMLCGGVIHIVGSKRVRLLSFRSYMAQSDDTKCKQVLFSERTAFVCPSVRHGQSEGVRSKPVVTA
jgi:hypothetical protein